MSDPVLSEAQSLLAQITGEEHNDLADASVPELTSQIRLLKQQAAINILEIGRRLNEAKKKIPHGEWVGWLEQQVEFTERTAQRFMRAARECANTTAMSHLSPTKVLMLLDLPAEERVPFAEQAHTLPSGETKTVDEMTVREMQRLIQETKRLEMALAKAEQEKTDAEKFKNEAYDLARDRGTTIETLQRQLAERPEKKVEKIPEDYKSLKVKANQTEALTKTLDDIKRQLEQEKAKNDALAMEVKAYKTTEVDSKAAIQVQIGVLDKLVKDFLGRVAPLAFIGSEYAKLTPDNKKQYTAILAGVQSWLDGMQTQMGLSKDRVIDVEVIDRD